MLGCQGGSQWARWSSVPFTAAHSRLQVLSWAPWDKHLLDAVGTGPAASLLDSSMRRLRSRFQILGSLSLTFLGSQAFLHLHTCVSDICKCRQQLHTLHLPAPVSQTKQLAKRFLLSWMPLPERLADLNPKTLI